MRELTPEDMSLLELVDRPLIMLPVQRPLSDARAA